MNSCERVDSLLSAYLESETSPAETRFIEGHLTVCARCREQVDGTAILLERLSRLPRVGVSDGFTGRVLAEVKGLPAAGLDEPVVPMPSSGRAVRWAAPLAAAAALAVALIGYSQLRSPEPRTNLAEATRAPATTPAPADRGTVDLGANPPVASIPDLYPGIDAKAEGPGQPLGMAGDSYALEDWVLREPSGGGDAVLTRVGSDPSAKVVVTF